jgi:four helix bundle protein
LFQKLHLSFELSVYKKAKAFNTEINSSILRNDNLDSVVKNQLRRAALSIVLNIAEGSSRFSKPDRKNYSVISRGSVFECVAIVDILKDTGLMKTQEINQLYSQAEDISKIIFAMIKNLEK